ncbi:MAG: glycerophosphodiester phosphodiesterase family protein [Bacteroidota bacterium]
MHIPKLFTTRLSFFILVIFVFASCQELIDAPVPNSNWALFQSAETKPLTTTERQSLDGVYKIEQADYPFGKSTAGKWSYTINGTDTTHHFTFFCEEEATHFICEGRRLKDTILLNGYWRKMVNTQTGKVQLMIIADSLNQNNLTIKGKFGDGEEAPDEDIAFIYLRPLYNKTPMVIVGHRGGGRGNDLLPASENSLEMIKLAARLGATGVEIDVQLTKDGIPVLYHDSKINDRLTEKAGIRGSLSEYKLAELKDIRLKRGGKIPTLQQALDTILFKTPLQFIWLDCKEKNLDAVHQLQKMFLQKANAAGRDFTIVIGVPDEDVLKGFAKLPDHHNIPSLTELDTTFARTMNANYWAPSWTKGLQLPEVNAMHTQKRKVIVWTVDPHKKIEEFINRGRFDGICSNRLGVVAHYYYCKQ